jgi:hypothetical protein
MLRENPMNHDMILGEESRHDGQIKGVGKECITHEVVNKGIKGAKKEVILPFTFHGSPKNAVKCHHKYFWSNGHGQCKDVSKDGSNNMSLQTV